MAPRTFRRALVTGASNGIGEALARELADRGVHVVLVARTADRLERLAADLRAAAPIEAEALPADLTSDEGLEEVAARLRRTDAPVDLLINNAGVGQVGRFVELDLDGAEQQVRLNVVAPLRLTHVLLPRLRAHGGGVLNVSSIAATQPVPVMATYGGTKAFLTSWSQAVREELRGEPVHLTVLAPGFTRTGFVDAAEADSQASLIPGFVWDDARDVARAGIDGVARNRSLVVPGLLYRTGVTLSDVTPSAVSRRLIGQFTRLSR